MIGEVATLVFAISTLVGVVALTVFVFRRPGSNLSIKHKDTEIALVTSLPPKQLESVSLQEAEQPVEPPSEQAQTVAGIEVEQESRFAKGYRLLVKGQFTEGIALVEQEAANESTAEARLSVTAFGLHLAAGRGNDEARTRLEKLVSDNPALYEGHLWLGSALERLGESGAAIASFDNAFQAATTDENRASALSFSANLLARRDDPSPAVQFLLDNAARLGENRSKARLIARAAAILLEKRPEEKSKALFLYEYAISLNPADTALRFDTAFAYGEAEAHALAMVHYSRLVAADADHAGALNNLGVAEAALSMEVSAVRHYSSAADLGNTLASANLAWKLIGSGFIDQARQLLESASSKEDVHRNVLAALGGIAKTESDEEDRRKSLESAVEWIREIQAAVGESLSTPEPSMQFGGRYVEETRFLLLSNTAASTISGSWDGFYDGRDVQGTRISSRAFAFTWSTRRNETGGGLSALLIGKKGAGVLLLRENEQMVGYSYDGDVSADPARATGFTKLRYRRVASVTVD